MYLLTPRRFSDWQSKVESLGPDGVPADTPKFPHAPNQYIPYGAMVASAPDPGTPAYLTSSEISVSPVEFAVSALLQLSVPIQQRLRVRRRRFKSHLPILKRTEVTFLSVRKKLDRPSYPVEVFSGYLPCGRSRFGHGDCTCTIQYGTSCPPPSTWTTPPQERELRESSPVYTSSNQPWHASRSRVDPAAETGNCLKVSNGSPPCHSAKYRARRARAVDDEEVDYLTFTFASEDPRR